jgi:hypothetical protein
MDLFYIPAFFGPKRVPGTALPPSRCGNDYGLRPENLMLAERGDGAAANAGPACPCLASQGRKPASGYDRCGQLHAVIHFATRRRALQRE